MPNRAAHRNGHRPAPQTEMSSRAALLFFGLLALLFLCRSLLGGDVFLPAGLLRLVSPWRAMASSPGTHWNALRWDAIGQFYPWRKFAAESIRAGIVPLWNPWQFCGTPFVANSQSAVFYPGNLLFWLMPDPARAFALSAALHLTLAGWFTYLLLRELGSRSRPALFAGAIFAFSAWQVAWLQLPTFLSTSCWIPLVLLLVRRICRPARAVSRGTSTTDGEPDSEPPPAAAPPEPSRVGAACGLAAAVGCMLLAGHLQIAFYGLLAASLWAIGHLLTGSAALGERVRGLALLLGASGVGLLLVSPQLLPALELSRQSHRVGKPSAAGYAAYSEYALPPHSLATLGLPGLFGSDTDPDDPYWNYYVKRIPGGAVAVRHNAAETALYIGIIPLFFALLAPIQMIASRRRDRVLLFFTLLALLAMLVALGSPVNALFYYGVPGFGQSGSPARCLVLWAFACAVLGGLGLDRVLRDPPTVRQIAATAAVALLLLAIGLSQTAQAVSAGIAGMRDVPGLGEAFGRIPADWIRLPLFAVQALLLAWLAGRGHRAHQSRPVPPLEVAASSTLSGPSGEAGAAATEELLAPAPAPLLTEEGPAPGAEPITAALASPTVVGRSVPFSGFLSGAALAMSLLDLFLVGFSQNPTASREALYPEMPGTSFLRASAGHDRIFPVNRHWSLYVAPEVVLPPNCGMVYHLRDVQGYDSLLTGQYKQFANTFSVANRAGLRDASPPEVGNMVFLQNPNLPEVALTGARFAVATPLHEASSYTPPIGQNMPLSTGDPGMDVFPLPNGAPRAVLLPSVPGGAPAMPPVTYLEDGPTRVALTVDAPVPATLRLADQYYPGWRSTLDGAALPIHRAVEAPVFRAVAVPAGRHRIAFRYEPASYRLGLFLACLGCAFLAGCASFRRIAAG